MPASTETTDDPRSLPSWPFAFDSGKGVESVLYVAARIPKPNFHSIFKVMFHADKLHLSRYGRPVSGDRYIAMKHGPVPSATYDILKTLRGEAEFSLPDYMLDALSVDGYLVQAKRPANEKVLSKSDMECLSESAHEHGSKSFTQLSEESHGLAWKAADENDVILLENLLLEIDNREELRDYFAHYGT